MRPLIWFRSDLRTRDNLALFDAARDADNGAVGVFLISPAQWQEHDWGDAKVDMILRTLADLRDRLETRNIPLLLPTADRFDDAPDTLLRLAREHDCDTLSFNNEYEVNERERDEAVEAGFGEHAFEVRRFDDQTILPPGDVRTGQGGYYGVFTPYKRTWWRTVLERLDALEPAGLPKKQREMIGEPDDVPERIPGFNRIDLADHWPAGEEYALRTLRDFTKKRIDAYSDQRDTPAVDGTSRLSPHLAVGSISARTCLHEVLDAHPNADDDDDSGPAVWLSEIIWREFYRHVMVGHPRISRNRAFKPHTERVAWRDDDDGFDAWTDGRTGIPVVDAGMRQLREEAWMHNRVRMITAMFLTKNLLIDWRRGERHFMRHLIDGDLASNNGGWQWSASTGTDAAPYFRVFNPVSQSKRFDPEGDYIRRYVPELADLDARDIHDPPPAARADCDYPEPIVDLKSSRKRAIDAFKALG